MSMENPVTPPIKWLYSFELACKRCSHPVIHHAIADHPFRLYAVYCPQAGCECKGYITISEFLHVMYQFYTEQSVLDGRYRRGDGTTHA